jgi:hypothetical protein
MRLVKLLNINRLASTAHAEGLATTSKHDRNAAQCSLIFRSSKCTKLAEEKIASPHSSDSSRGFRPIELEVAPAVALVISPIDLQTVFWLF